MTTENSIKSRVRWAENFERVRKYDPDAADPLLLAKYGSGLQDDQRRAEEESCDSMCEKVILVDNILKCLEEEKQRVQSLRRIRAVQRWKAHAEQRREDMYS